MAEASNGQAAPAAQADAKPQPRLQILTQFIRDMSFENVAAQRNVKNEGKPDVRVHVNLDAKKLADDQYDVGLKVKVDSKVGEATLFLLELDYAGRFRIENVPAEQLNPLLMIECPRLIFPYVRRIVGDVTRDGGYPPINLETIDFLALYRQALAQRQQAGASSQVQQA